MSINTNTRNSYTVEFKIRVAKAYDLVRQPQYGTSRLNSMLEMVASDFNVSSKSVLRWHSQWSKGELSLSNAIAVSRKPTKVINGDIYHLAGKDFKSKDEAIRYAVELAGGLTVTKMTTIAVEV